MRYETHRPSRNRPGRDRLRRVRPGDAPGAARGSATIATAVVLSPGVEPLRAEAVVVAETAPSDAVAGEHPVSDLPVPLELLRAVEAMVMVADSPLEPQLIGELLELPPDIVEEICVRLARSYEDENRGFRLSRIAGGYRFESHPDLAPWVERYVLDGQVARLSAAAMETLAIVAYKQPISRAQVSAIRGVSVDGVVRTLSQRGYIIEVARDPGPGQAVLYGTTPEFLERLGLDSVDHLPPIADFVPGAEIMEALENSLRVVPDVAEAVPDDDNDEVVIDLRDGVTEPLGVDVDETIDRIT